ncbi:MAG: cytochrome c peroxidase [Myxococcota bacterium]
MRWLLAATALLMVACSAKCPEGACRATPMKKTTLLPGEEGKQREHQAQLRHDLRATQQEVGTMLASQPEPPDVLARREARRKEEGASRIVTSLDELLQDRTAAIALGKALFWDVRVGSDDQTACATCHSYFGADARPTRGSWGVAARVFAPPVATAGERMLKASPRSPERERGLGLREAARPEKSNSGGRRPVSEAFRRLVPAIDSADFERKVQVELAQFDAAENGRTVTGRAAPTVHGALWFDRLFFDGRARSVFNGYDLLGDDAFPDSVGLYLHGTRVLVRLPHAALASQALGPLVALEMSYFGRRPSDIGKKLLPSRALAEQKVSLTDSHLARCDGAGSSCVDASGQFTVTYRELVEKAFKPGWCTDALVTKDVRGQALTACEANFALFFGVAVMLYEEQLVPDETRFDQHFRADQGVLSPSELAGLQVFESANCSVCHALPETSVATRAHVYGPLLEFEAVGGEEEATDDNDFVRWLLEGSRAEDHRVEWMKRGVFSESGLVPYDRGFYNLGLRPTADDPGIGSRFREPGDGLPYFHHYGLGKVPLDAPPPRFSRVAEAELPRAFVRGAFKTPHLRNVSHTAPYFHPGGGDAAGPGTLESELIRVYCPRTAFPLEGVEDGGVDHVHPLLTAPAEQWNCAGLPELTAFLKALTDERAVRRAAPFDHPSLAIPCSRDVGRDGRTPDTGPFLNLPETGASGTDLAHPRCP